MDWYGELESFFCWIARLLRYVLFVRMHAAGISFELASD